MIRVLVCTIGILCAAEYVRGCQCQTYNQPRTDARSYYTTKFDGAIFTGTITAIRSEANAAGIASDEIEVSVDEQWRGIATQTVIVRSPDASCGIHRKVGEKDFFIASRGQDGLSLALCDLANWGAQYSAPGWRAYTERILGKPGSLHKRKPHQTGTWSAPVDGLRGRLLVTPGDTFNGTRMLVVYLELENVSNVANPLEIYFDEYRTLESKVVDGEGKPLKQPPVAASILSPGPYWLTIPVDGLLRFRVSVSGYGIYKDSGTDLPMSSGNWVIPRGDKKEYFLEATFKADPDKAKPRAWQGTLSLPRVPIPH